MSKSSPLRFLAADQVLPNSSPLPRPGLLARMSNRLAMHLPIAPFDASQGRGLVTFTFDDVPVSAATYGADMLEENNARGTFYIASGLLGTYADHWQVIGPDAIVDLHTRGHEIGSHSHSHARADAMNADDMEIDILHNRNELLAIEPSLRIENFAYPYGYASLSWKKRLNRIFQSSRSITPRVNQGTTDRQYLRALPLIDREMDQTGIDRAMAEAVETNSWAIFYAHDITYNPSDYGCTPRLLSHALKAAQRNGLAVTTIAQGLAEKATSK